MLSKILIVLGHGRQRSLGHRLTSVVESTARDSGAEVRVQDLLRDEFDPVLRLPDDARHALPRHSTELARQYQRDVQWMEGLVVVHPVWWFGPPAILKGWVDQVLVDGVAIRQQDEGSPKPLLKGRRALLVQTYNASRAVDRIVMRKMSEQFWRRAVFLSVGILRSKRLAFYGVDGIPEKRVGALCAQVAQATRRWLA